MSHLPRPNKAHIRHTLIAGLTFVLGTGCLAAEPDFAELGRSQMAIVGGDLDESTDGVVGLAIDLGRNVAAGHCSGTLIAPNLVLTARHCISHTSTNNDSGTVECNKTRFEDTMDASSILVSTEAVRPKNGDHDSYVRGLEVHTLGSSSDVCGQDIALVILEKAVTHIAPITPRVGVEPSYGEQFTTVGYGLTDPGNRYSDGTRQRAEGSAVRCTGEDCVRLSDGSIRTTEWASIDAPICSGDSGGPALDSLGRVFGVASRGDAKCEIAVYGDVSSFGPFIVDTALTAAQIGRYAPPVWTEPNFTDLSASVLLDTAYYTDTEASLGTGCSLGTPASQRLPGSSSLPFVLGVVWWMRRTSKHSSLRKPKTPRSLA